MRKPVVWGRKRYEPRERPYKCANRCGATVERPDTVCICCTLDELYEAKRSESPKDAA